MAETISRRAQLLGSADTKALESHSSSSFTSLRALIPLCLLSLAACSTIRTTTEPVGGRSYAENNKARVGLYYFLPRALITIECVQAKDGIFSVNVTRKMVADRTHRYHLRWTRNPFYDDKISNPIEVNEEGLLTNVEMSTTDQTPAIAADLVSSAINVFKILGGGGAQAGRLEEGYRKLQPFKYTFDPLDEGEVAETCRSLRSYGIKVYIDAGGPHRLARSRYQNSKDGTFTYASDAVPDSPDGGGVFFHPPTTVNLRFDFRDAGAELIHRQNVAIPDPSRVACFRFGRSPLVRRDTTLTLVDGVPTSFKVERPSVLKGLTGTVSGILGTVSDAIPTIVNVQNSKDVSELNAEKAHLAAEKEVVAQQKQLLLEKKQLLDAERALADAQNGGGAESGHVDHNEPAGDQTSADGFTPNLVPSPTPHQ